MSAYYNEYDPQAAAWLRELIKRGLIAPGEVDERSIADVKADDIRGFSQCHFFAGIGGWSYALRLAGWPDDRPCWTGSPPCQPFSNAGKRKAQADTRHLWPVFFNLIRECKPEFIFGEQVAAAINHGWLDLIQTDLASEGYSSGGAVLGAHSVGAPHIRQRLYFGAHRVVESEIAEWRGERNAREHSTPAQVRRSSEPVGLADSKQQRLERYAGNGDDRNEPGRLNQEEARSTAKSSGDSRLADTEHPERRAVSQHRQNGRNGQDTRRQEAHGLVRTRREVHGMAESDGARRQQGQRNNQAAGHGNTFATEGGDDRYQSANEENGFWRAADWLWCRDGKWRPVESSTFPLAHGLPARVVRLRGYGNAIVPAVAAQVIRAYMEIKHETTD